MKRKPGIWVHYDQIQGEWSYRISDGNTYIWSGEAWRTEFEAENAAIKDFTEAFPKVAVPLTTFHRTALEYARASLREDQQK